ncbi:hypothetical protein ACFL03_03730, partial [Thermodesulfobacteriota bacterium]
MSMKQYRHVLTALPSAFSDLLNFSTSYLLSSVLCHLISILPAPCSKLRAPCFVRLYRRRCIKPQALPVSIKGCLESNWN